MSITGLQSESSKGAEGSAAEVSVRTPVEKSTVTALTEQSVLSARRWVLTMLILAGASFLVVTASLRFGVRAPPKSSGNTSPIERFSQT